MTVLEYVEALHSAGVPREITVTGLDHEAALLLKVDVRTARRYRRGEIQVPGPVQVALRFLAKSVNTR